MKLKIADLTTALSDAKLGLVDVAQLLKDKDVEIADLKKAVKYRAENLIDQDGFRYLMKDGKASGLPFCPACEAKGLFLRLAQDRNTPGHPYKCPSCKADYGYGGVMARG